MEEARRHPNPKDGCGLLLSKRGALPPLSTSIHYMKKKGTCKTESKFVTDSASYTISGRKKGSCPKNAWRNFRYSLLLFHTLFLI
ncbi:hypothetical protein HMPREF1246_0954 [Acidaminococcus sp. BV3L6]|nr:hypothetical protein HMPREF1246_0954 [Acidaminococcus sp. BV3L6]